MKLLYKSAMRSMELRNLRIEDLDFESKDDFSHIIQKGKGGKPRKFDLD
jgi:integrase